MNRKELQAIIEHNQNVTPDDRITVVSRLGRRTVWMPISIETAPHSTGVVVHRVDIDDTGSAVVSDHQTTYASRDLSQYQTLRSLSHEGRAKVSRLDMVASVIQSSRWAMDPVVLADSISKRLDTFGVDTTDSKTTRDHVLRHHLSVMAEQVIADRFDLAPIGNAQPVEVWWGVDGRFRVSFDVDAAHLVALLTDLTVGDRS